jgi:hypothetical protein
MKRPERLLASKLGLFCTLALLYARGAHAAEDASAAETAAARSLAVDGLKLAQAGNCEAAVPKLERAEKLYHAPVVASRLGECYVSLGKLVEGTEILRKVLREPQPADANPALLKALERAQKVLDSAKPRIAGLTLKIATVQDMSVKIDGQSVPLAMVDTEIPTDPGEHSVEVSAPGFLKSASRVSVAEGEKKNVTFTLTRDPNYVAPAAPAPATSSSSAESVPAPGEGPTREHAARPETKPKVERAPNRTAAYVTFGLGAAGLATGGVLGLMTMQKHSDLEGKCPNNVCPGAYQGDLDSAKTLGTVSTVAFAVGGAGVVLGSVLFFTASPSGVDHAHSPAKSRLSGLSRPRVAIGPGQLQLGADF